MQAPDPPPIALPRQGSYASCGKVGKMAGTHRLSEILLVDDDSLEAATVRRTLRDLAVTNKLVHVTDGCQGLAHRKARTARCPV